MSRSSARDRRGPAETRRTAKPGSGRGNAGAKRVASSRRGGSRSGSRVFAFLRATSVNGRLPAFLLSVGLIVLLFGFLFSSDFAVRSVVVQGNTLAYADSIVETSGALGEPLFRLDTEAVARRVASHPAVASAEVTATFPNRVVIHLHERVPVLVWQLGEHAVLVDQRGWVIAEGYDPKLPRILQQGGELPAVGKQIPGNLIQATKAIGEKLGDRLATLEYDPQQGLTAQLNDGRTVVFGSSDRIPLKLNVVAAVLSSVQDSWAKLDVREPERPYYQ